MRLGLKHLRKRKENLEFVALIKYNIEQKLHEYYFKVAVKVITYNKNNSL